MSKLTDTQLVILSTASRRNDRGVDLPTSVPDESVRKAVDELIGAGLLEEVRPKGSLLAWRRDAAAGPMALRITKQGLKVTPTPEAESPRLCQGTKIARMRKKAVLKMNCVTNHGP